MADIPLYRFSRKQVLPISINNGFAFFQSAENLREITPGWMDFKLLTPAPVAIERGTIIDYTIRIAGLRTRWRTIITSYDPPYGFTDEQLMGPFSYWQHRHRFEQSGNGICISDMIHYALPNWLPDTLARMINRVFVLPRLQQIFDYRAEQYSSLLCGQDLHVRSLAKHQESCSLAR
jgi:ligand-binding SRPBCC domain-containing protein